jgi:antitoxin VapB
MTPKAGSGEDRLAPWASGQEIDADIANTMSSEEISVRLNTSREAVNAWRLEGRLLGVEGAKRGLRYPAEQFGPNDAPLPVGDIIREFDGDHWAAWQFLAMPVNELGGATGFELLRAGKVEDRRGSDTEFADSMSVELAFWVLSPAVLWHMLQAYAWRCSPMGEQRHVRLFRNGRNQAVRIPVEFELPGDEAIMHRDGERLIIEPLRKRGLIALLKSMKPLDEEFPEIEDPVPPPERVL